MPTQFIKYQLDENTTILVQAPDGFEPKGSVKAAVGDEEGVTRSTKTFQQAMEPVHQGALWMLEKLHDLQADEVELKFGLVTTGELGNFAIGKVGVEANYEVTLKWTKKEDDDLHKKIEAIQAKRLRRKANSG